MISFNIVCFLAVWLCLLCNLKCLVAAQLPWSCSNCRYGSDYCDVHNHNCLFGCESGYHGINCSLPCTIRNCLECVKAPNSLEQCTMCTGNVYGPLCNINCHRNCRGLASTSRSTCDQKGKCIYGCELGYHGDKCNEVECNYANCRTCGVQWNGHVYCERCIDGYYYHVDKGCIRCSQNCLTPYDCHPHSGDCNGGCRPGMFGNQCNLYCTIANCNTCYAPVSEMSILCKNCTSGNRPSYNQKECIPCGEECVGCDSATGYCTSCGEGLFGHKCQYQCSIPGCKKCFFDTIVRKASCSLCKEGYYQLRDPLTKRIICENCSDTCQDGLCNISTGNCFSCATGFYGRIPLSKGDSCRFKCSEHCVTEHCDQDSGACVCKPGWFGTRCDRNCPLKCSSCVGFENGKCPSCEPGYYGNLCDKRCPANCEKRRSSTTLPKCDQDSGHCEFGCQAKFFGPWCNETCGSGCDGGCNKVSGECQTGCTTFWYGPKCDQRCSDNCVADSITSLNRPCDMISGRCSQGCTDNYHGEKCDKICNYKCKQQKCFQDTGICKFGCMTGWIGVNCSEQCNQNCPDECMNCVDRYCDAKTKDCLQGCIPGFYGPKCQNNCSPNCLNKKCDQNTGICQACVDGFYGPSCTLECSPTCKDRICSRDNGECRGCVDGTHGYKCGSKCPENCYTLKCKQDNGDCEDGCIEGFFEKQCDKECWDGWYGKDCSKLCGHCKDGTPCKKTDGHCISGCDIGYGGDKCNYAMSQEGPTIYDKDRVAIIAGVSVSVILVLAIVITVAILCYCRSLKTRRKKTEEPTVVFTTRTNSVQVGQPGSNNEHQNDSDVSLHQMESHLLGSVQPEIRCTGGIVAHRDYYVLHRGTVVKHGERDDAYVKVLLLNDTAEKRTHLSWLKQEVEILEMCTTHPNIVSLLSVEQKPERYKVALSSCMQNNLVPYLHEINHSDDDDVDRFYHHQMIQFAVDIIDALCFLHRQKIIHRYIRARSVYLSDNLVAKLGDFDFAIIDSVDSDSVDNRRRDLPSTYSCWLAPEALISNTYSSQSDIWGYGMLLWEIFTLGQHPYDRMEGETLQRAIVDGQRPSKPGLASLYMYRLMKSCWRYSPEDRPTADSVLCQLTETQCNRLLTTHFAIPFRYRLMKSCWRYSPEDRPTADSVLCQLTETQAGMCGTCSETTLLVFSRGGSNVIPDSEDTDKTDCLGTVQFNSTRS